ncbi:hypothetical protein [Pyrobaculum sp.]|uniref:hypothetical protein n=1 Tax=Pyrobaculum sp. TaxID=2004705 RepID=UPI003D13076B
MRGLTTLRDIVMFAGLVAAAVAIITSLYPVREGPSEVPACSDCAFKLVGPYVVRQYDSYAAVESAGRQLARYGWAYYGGYPLAPGQNATCGGVMYLWVVNGVVYVSCDGTPPRLGQFIAAKPRLELDTSAFCQTGCVFVSASDGWGQIALPVTASIWGSFLVIKTANTWFWICIGIKPPPEGGYYVEAVFPGNSSLPPMSVHKTVIVETKAAISGSNYILLQGSDPDDYRPTALKVFNLTAYWSAGSTRARIYVNPVLYFDVEDKGALLDYLLAWEDCQRCDPPDGFALYYDEVWRLWYDGRWHLERIRGWCYNEVSLNGTVVKPSGYCGSVSLTWSGNTADIYFKSVVDGAMNARFTVKYERVCREG